MAVQRSAMLPSSVVAVVVSLSFMVAACGAQLPTGCPPVDHRGDNATLFANPYNCSTFYICAQGKPVLLECPNGLQFSDSLKTCDHAYNVHCVPLQPTPAPEQVEVVTTKVVLTKIVKEVFKPEGVNVATVTVKNDVSEPEVQPPTDRPAVVDADVSLGEVLSKPIVAVGDSQPAVVSADVDASVSDVNSAVEPVADTVDDTANSGLLGNLINADVNLGLL